MQVFRFPPCQGSCFTTFHSTHFALNGLENAVQLDSASKNQARKCWSDKHFLSQAPSPDWPASARLRFVSLSGCCRSVSASVFWNHTYFPISLPLHPCHRPTSRLRDFQFSSSCPPFASWSGFKNRTKLCKMWWPTSALWFLPVSALPECPTRDIHRSEFHPRPKERACQMGKTRKQWLFNL